MFHIALTLELTLWYKRLWEPDTVIAPQLVTSSTGSLLAVSLPENVGACRGGWFLSLPIL